MALKYSVVEIDDLGVTGAILFKFDDPLVSLEVARQLKDKNYGSDYIVVVKDE